MVYKFEHDATDDFAYNEARIDVWHYSLLETHDEDYLILNQEEQDRANRYYFEKHKRRFIKARATLRLILSRYLNINPKHITFTSNAYGKPALLHDTSLQFNLSHSGEHALLAIGAKHPLGIDLECFSARPYEGIAQEMFSQRENQAFKQIPDALKTLTFFHIWSQKEAFIKAAGLGLSYPTKQFNVPIHAPTHQTIWDPLHEIMWKMTSFMPIALCSAALCYHPNITDIRLKTTKLPEHGAKTYEKA